MGRFKQPLKVRASVARAFTAPVKAFTDTPRLFGFLSERHKVQGSRNST